MSRYRLSGNISDEEHWDLVCNALSAMPYAEMAKIYDMADQIVSKIKAKKPKILFNQQNALELLSEIGILLYKGSNEDKEPLLEGELV